MAASMKMRSFWDIAPCSFGVDRRFRAAYCLHHQGDETSVCSNETARRYIPEGSKLSVYLCSKITSNRNSLLLCEEFINACPLKEALNRTTVQRLVTELCDTGSPCGIKHVRRLKASARETLRNVEETLMLLSQKSLQRLPQPSGSSVTSVMEDCRAWHLATTVSRLSSVQILFIYLK
jgi:hypothetical protein